MKTSGAATEHRMTIALVVVGVGIAMLLAGGPTELMIAFERALRSVGQSISQLWRG